MIDYRKLTTKDKCLSSVASYVEFESSYRQDFYWIQICQKCLPPQPYPPFFLNCVGHKSCKACPVLIQMVKSGAEHKTYRQQQMHVI